MSYNKTNWQDLPSTDTPIIANALNNMETGIADANGAIGVNTYSASSTYSVGDYCIYNNKLYKCTTAISTAEAFNSTKWTQIKMAEEINNTGVTVSSTEPTGNNKNRVWFKKSKNLFNGVFDNITSNGITASFSEGVLTLNGTATAQTEIYYTFINNIILKANTAYTATAFFVSGSMTGTANFYCQNSTNFKGFGVELGNSNKSFSRDNTYIDTDLVLNASNFVRIANGTTFNNYKVKFQIEEGSSVTTYEKYIIPQIYTRANTSYERTKIEENQIYSTDEVKTGTWIDGRQMYRRVISLQFGTVTTGTESEINTSISNVRFILVRDYWLDRMNETPAIINQGFYQDLIYQGYTSYGYGGCVLRFRSKNALASNKKVWAIIEYTKTTD